MKKIINLTTKTLLIVMVFCFSTLHAQQEQAIKEIKGKVIDKKTKDDLVFSDIVIANSNISTVTNTDGEFLLKIPENLLNGVLIVSHLGYQKKEIKISTLENKVKITLEPAVTELTAIEIGTYKDAQALLKTVLKNKSALYNNSHTVMTAFYRESIKKRKRNASLSEAVVKIHKRPYDSYKRDAIELIKSRKKTDYHRLDTLALKLQGGPFSNLYTDIIKYPEYIFTNEEIPLYDFKFAPSTRIDNNLIYVIEFKQKPAVTTPLYYGKLYIDSNTLALTNAVYNLNVENKRLTSQMYVRKKPGSAVVYPTQATYRVNYRTKDGKWQYAYSNISLSFKVNWKRKLFNNVFTLNSEMAVTDWHIQDADIERPRNKMMRPTTILVDATSGFTDPKFWGVYNIIEPEKSIESAIKKIKRQIEKSKVNQTKGKKA